MIGNTSWSVTGLIKTAYSCHENFLEFWNTSWSVTGLIKTAYSCHKNFLEFCVIIGIGKDWFHFFEFVGCLLPDKVVFNMHKVGAKFSQKAVHKAEN
jgi:hypothetical protein